MLLQSSLIAQNEFININDKKFSYKGSDYFFLGFNAYYLQSEAAKGNKYIVDEVFKAAEDCSVKVIRTWAFYENDNPGLNGVITYLPEKYNEKGLEALDYVLYNAKEKNIKLILTLANAFPAFGGIDQYINWANKTLSNTGIPYSYNDFFTNPDIKGWYKSYVQMLLNRKNTFNGIIYKEDPTIFSFELINEADLKSQNRNIIYEWYDEMSGFIKNIDKSHLVTTGEVGYDWMQDYYSDIFLCYNGSDFLFNGYKGTSFYNNSKLKYIDYASYHLYPDGWNISSAAGNTWIKEHEQIASSFGKPALPGEFGVRKSDKLTVYKDWLNTIFNTESKSALVWQYLHPDVINNDGYGFNLTNKELIELFRNYSDRLKDTAVSYAVLNEDFILYQNYPNPFNPVTKIRYSLPKDEYISLELYNTLGEKIGVIEEGFKSKGVYESILSFQNTTLASGVYIYALKTPEIILTKKLLLLK